MVLEWTPEEASLLQDRPFSAAASVYISREAWETQDHQTFSSISLLGTLGPGDRIDLSSTAACALLETLHYRSTSEESQNHLTFSHWVPKH